VVSVVLVDLLDGKGVVLAEVDDLDDVTFGDDVSVLVESAPLSLVVGHWSLVLSVLGRRSPV
jgi:hypothetical protein